MFLLRVISGLLLLQHGGQKLFGWFGGTGWSELSTLIMVAGVLEFFGGMVLVLGVFTRPIAFLLSGFMAVAYFTVHFPIGFWPIANGGDLAVLFAFVSLFFAFHGAGKWSLDHKFHRK